MRLASNNFKTSGLTIETSWQAFLDATKARTPQQLQTSAVEFTLITSRADFDALQDDWNALFARTGRPEHVFQTFNFCWHWANHYLASSERGINGVHLSIVTARRHGRLIMLWPLVTERIRGVSQLFWMGEPVSQYGDVLIDSVPDQLALLTDAWTFLRANQQADLLRLRHVREDAAIAPLLDLIGAEIVDSQIAPHINLTDCDSFETFEQRHSGKARKNRRRLAKRLGEKGSVEFTRFRGGPEARALAVQAVALKALWLRDRGRAAAKMADGRMSRLFADLAEARTRPAGCLVSALKLNGEAAALEISFVCKDRLSMHLITFSLAHEKSGTGVLLFEQSLKDGYAENLHVYDMLAPGDAYKFDWCDRYDVVRDWAVPMTAKGFVYGRIYLAILRERLKTMLSALSQRLGRRSKAGVR